MHRARNGKDNEKETINKNTGIAQNYPQWLRISELLEKSLKAVVVVWS